MSKGFSVIKNLKPGLKQPGYFVVVGFSGRKYWNFFFVSMVSMILKTVDLSSSSS